MLLVGLMFASLLGESVLIVGITASTRTVDESTVAIELDDEVVPVTA